MSLRSVRGSSGPKVPAAAINIKANQGTKILHTAVVVDVFSNPQMMSEIQKNLFKKGTTHGVAQASLIDSMPRNSIAAVLIDNVGGKINPDPMIFYPFFSPHLAMPVKPGEKVLVIFNEATDPINLKNINTQVLGYWMTRMSVDVDVDDVNYTHADRMHPQRVPTPPSIAGNSTEDDLTPILDFPNGDGTPEGMTLPKASSYEDIVSTSFGTRLATFATPPLSDAWGVAGVTTGMSNAVGAYEFTGEVVPRFTKNCSDMALQGSNNTLISLGEDITADLITVGGASAIASVTGGRGAIDLVAGRGQSSSTAPAAEKPNTRLYTETDKATANQNKDEGSPTSDDLSRVYISMKGTPAAFTGDDGMSLGFTPAAMTPFILAKSSAIRLVGGDVSILAGPSGAQFNSAYAAIQAPVTMINTFLPTPVAVHSLAYHACRAEAAAYAWATCMSTFSNFFANVTTFLNTYRMTPYNPLLNPTMVAETLLLAQMAAASSQLTSANTLISAFASEAGGGLANGFADPLFTIG